MYQVYNKMPKSKRKSDRQRRAQQKQQKYIARHNSDCRDTNAEELGKEGALQVSQLTDQLSSGNQDPKVNYY